MEKEKKEKWAILCGTGIVSDYLTVSKIFEATEKDIFHISPRGIEGGLVVEFCGAENSFPIKLTRNTKKILKPLINELNKIK